MKKIFNLSVIAVLFTGMLAVSSCNKEDLKIPYDLSGQKFCYNPNSFVDQYQTASIDVTAEQVKAIVTAAGGDLSKVKKANLKSGLYLTLDATSNGNIDEIGNIEVYMKETGTLGTELGTQIAYSKPITAGATQITLDVNGAEMISMLTKNTTISVKLLNKTALTAKCLVLNQGIIEVTVKQ